jgi:hypothetical protein
MGAQNERVVESVVVNLSKQKAPYRLCNLSGASVG